MKNIELPYAKDRKGHYRFFEILPGVVSYTMVLLPLILSLINVTVAAIFVLIYLLVNLSRGAGEIVAPNSTSASAALSASCPRLSMISSHI